MFFSVAVLTMLDKPPVGFADKVVDVVEAFDIVVGKTAGTAEAVDIVAGVGIAVDRIAVLVVAAR